ncbi:MAG: hypothetical protein DHS20C11_21320 [Lysobacteraceae bacterium]|nr:MAG: hypothetical protein DHS20C11_21320 [Xanthomonadaceae bacterium]
MISKVLGVLEARALIPLMPIGTGAIALMFSPKTLDPKTTFIVIGFCALGAIYVKLPRRAAEWQLRAGSDFQAVKDLILITRAFAVALIVIAPVLAMTISAAISGANSSLHSLFNSVVYEQDKPGTYFVAELTQSGANVRRVTGPTEQPLVVLEAKPMQRAGYGEITEQALVNIPSEGSLILVPTTELIDWANRKIVVPFVNVLVLISCIFTGILLFTLFFAETLSDAVRRTRVEGTGEEAASEKSAVSD